MRSSQDNPFTYFPPLFLLFIFLPSSSSNNLTLIQQTCEKCSETDPNLRYDFCEAALSAPPESPRYSSDLRRLGLLAIRLTKSNATATRRFIKRLVAREKRKLDPYVRACLSDCTELYTDASQTIKDAAKEYKAKQYDDAGFAMGSVIDAATTCEDGFADGNAVVSPLTKRNNDVFQLSAISLSIINMLNVG